MSAAHGLAELLQLVEERAHRRGLFRGLHPYRVMSQNAVSGRLNLQAVNEGDVLLPQTVEIPKAHGSPGIDEVCRPGTIVLVGFAGGSAGAPFVAHYLEAVRRPGEADTPQTPLSLELDASTDVSVGPSAATVTLAGGILPLALAAPVQALAAALATFASAAGTATNLGQVTAAAATLNTALQAISGYATTKVRGV